MLLNIIACLILVAAFILILFWLTKKNLNKNKVAHVLYGIACIIFGFSGLDATGYVHYQKASWIPCVILIVFGVILVLYGIFKKVPQSPLKEEEPSTSAQ